MTFLETLKTNFSEMMRPLGKWGRKPPVTTPEELREFIESRAGYTAQVTLYGYLKARVGTRYPSLIEDPEFASSMTIARTTSTPRASEISRFMRWRRWVPRARPQIQNA